MGIVDSMLNKITYSDDPYYVPSDFALGFVNFIKLVNGEEGEQNVTPVFHYKMLDLLASRETHIANMIFRGSGKALGLDTLIMTPTGMVKLSDIQVGDIVIDRNGEHTKVIGVSKTFTNKAYKFVLTDGSSFVANEDHLHILQRRSVKPDHERGRRTNGKFYHKNVWKEEILTTKELLNRGAFYNRRESTYRNPKGYDIKWFIPLVEKAIDFVPTSPCIDPYTIGAILGDGHISPTGMPIMTGHVDDIQEMYDRIPYEKSEIIQYKSASENARTFRIHQIGHLLREYMGVNIHNTKAIPQDILFGSKETRIEVLRGLMDTDGTISDKGHYSFSTTSKSLAYGLHHIVKSLGGMSRVMFTDNDYSGHYRVSFNLQNINPFYMQRKRDRWKANAKYKTGKRVGIDKIIEMPAGTKTKCIMVDSPTKSFLIEESVVTHNSTIWGEYLFLYLALYGEIPYLGSVRLALYISDSMDNGIRNMRKNLEYRWQSSEFLQQYVPKAKFIENRWEFTNVDGFTFIVKGYGSTQGIRGVKEMGVRPTLAVADDIIGDDDARSPTVIANIEDTVHKAVEHALHPTQKKFLWLGTPFNQKDPLYKVIDSGAWTSNVFPVCEKFPCSRSEFKGAWEDRFPYSAIKEQYDKAKALGKVDAFNQELMLRIMSEEERLVQDSDIRWYKHRKVIDHIQAFNIYITTDFATSDSEAADWSVINVWALNNVGSWYWIDGFYGKVLLDRTIKELFRLAQRWRPQSVAIEVTGQQGGFIKWIQTMMLDKNQYFTLATGIGSNKIGIRPTKDKMSRFQTNAVPLFKAGKMYFPEELKNSRELEEMLAELSMATVKGFKSRHDDFIDTITQLGEIDVWRPSEPSVLEDDVDGDPTDFIWDDDNDKEVVDSSYFV